VIESERPAPVAGIGHDGRPRVVGAPGNALGPGDEHRRDRVLARVPVRIGVGPELADELDRKRRLLAGFPDGGRFERLAVVDETAGQRPAGGRVLPLDEDDAALLPGSPDLNDDVDGRDGIAVAGAGHVVLVSAGPL